MAEAVCYTGREGEGREREGERERGRGKRFIMVYSSVYNYLSVLTFTPDSSEGTNLISAPLLTPLSTNVPFLSSLQGQITIVTTIRHAHNKYHNHHNNYG